MSFRHLVLGFVSTALVASTLSVQAVTPITKPAASNNTAAATPATTAATAATTSTAAAASTAPAAATWYSSKASLVDPYSWGTSAAVLDAFKQAAKLKKAKNSKGAEKALLAISHRVDGIEKPRPVDVAMVNMAITKFYRDAKKYDDAMAYANRLLQTDTERFGEKSIFVAEDLKLLGDIYLANKAYDEAAKTYQKSLKNANKASESEYCHNIKSQANNKARKQQLLMEVYNGLAVANFQPPDPDYEDDGTAAAAADAYFNKAVKEILKSSDNINKYDRANQLFERYKEYLKTSDQTDKVQKADQQIDDYERKIQADREYKVPVN